MTSGPVDEQLSAWLDDELAPAETELLVRRLSQDQERRAVVARYGLIGECLRTGPSSVQSALAMSQRVSAALEASGSPAAVPPGASAGRGARRLLAVAAAAVVAVAVLLVDRSPPVATNPNIQGAGFTPLASAVSTARIDGQAQAALSPQRLAGYLVRHGEYSGFLAARLTDSHIVNNQAYSRLSSVPGATTQ